MVFDSLEKYLIQCKLKILTKKTTRKFYKTALKSNFFIPSQKHFTKRGGNFKGIRNAFHVPVIVTIFIVIIYV